MKMETKSLDQVMTELNNWYGQLRDAIVFSEPQKRQEYVAEQFEQSALELARIMTGKELN